MSALLLDLYELTMAESYVAEGISERPATFQLACRRLPSGWGYLLAAGLEDVLATLSGLRFCDEELAYLASTDRFTEALLDRLRSLRFTGEVRALPEGTAVFADEPLVEVTAPLIEAQLVETAVINHVHFQTLIASKAARCVDAAAGRDLVDFGMRRTHGLEAALLVARSSFLAGFAATSDVQAGRLFGIPLAGTMAHSFVECFQDEREAFAAYLRSYPEGSTLLVDTYDTPTGTRHAAEAAAAVAAHGGRVAGIRLDSGDLLALSRSSRAILDAAGLPGVTIFASGSLDEREIGRLVAAGAPIDGFGVGTKLGVSAGAPHLDIAYKLVEFDGRPTLKLSPGKETLPGRKQLWRETAAGLLQRDILALEAEPAPAGGCPLLCTVVRDGTRVWHETLADARERAARERASLPPQLRSLDATAPEVVLGRGLVALRDRAAATAAAANLDQDGPPVSP